MILLLIPLGFCLWAMLVFLVVKAVAMGAEKLITAATVKPLSPKLLNPLVAIASIAIACVVPMKGCEQMQINMYVNAIPPQLEIAELTYHDEQNDLREGCGVAIFSLAPRTVSRVKEEGLAFLGTASLGRSQRAYHRYEAWQPTPAPEPPPPRLLRGAHCASPPPATWEAIEAATHQPGSFYTTGPEHDLVLIPSLGILVFSFNG